MEDEREYFETCFQMKRRFSTEACAGFAADDARDQFHRTRFRAKRRRARSVAQVFPILQPHADAAVMTEQSGGVSRAVSVPADVAENWADVQARAAANAMQRVALLGIGEQFRTTMIRSTT